MDDIFNRKVPAKCPGYADATPEEKEKWRGEFVASLKDALKWHLVEQADADVNLLEQGEKFLDADFEQMKNGLTVDETSRWKYDGKFVIRVSS